jgi:outer membrane protein, heavy metal efflux system
MNLRLWDTMSSTRRGCHRLSIAISSLEMVACVSPSIGPDVSRVEALTRATELAAVHETDVEPVSHRKVERMLEQPLEIETAVRIALLNNRELRATLREMGIARGLLMQAALVPNPIVEVELFPERDTQVEFRLEYEVTRALFAPARSGVARANLEAERFRAAGAVIETGVAVRRAFYALQAAEQRLAVGQRVLDAYAAGRDAALALFEAGNIPEVDLAVQVAAFERSRATVARMELEVAERREVLQRLLGLFGEETHWEVAGELPSLPEASGVHEEIESRAIERSIELAELRHRLEATQRRVRLARRVGAVPDIALDVHALYGRPDLPRAEVDDPVLFGTGVAVRLPLFDRQQGIARAHEAEFNALLERYYGVAIAIRSFARDMRNRLVSTHARARQYAEVIVPAQKRVTDESLRQYNAMQIGVFELLVARREQLEAELEAIEALSEYWIAAAGLEGVLAGGLAVPRDRLTPSTSLPGRDRTGGLR